MTATRLPLSEPPCPDCGNGDTELIKSGRDILTSHMCELWGCPQCGTSFVVNVENPETADQGTVYGRGYPRRATQATEQVDRDDARRAGL